MRILFLHEVNYLEKPIFEMHEFPEHLAARGNEVAFVHFPEGYSKQEIRALGWKKRIQGRVVPESSLSLYTTQNASGTFLGRLKTAATFHGQFKKILRDFKPDVVVSFSVPTSGWQALHVCRDASIPFMYRALDVSHKIRSSFFSTLVYLAERYVNRKSSWVSANNTSMLAYCRRLGSKESRSSVEFPPVDLNHFAAVENFTQNLDLEIPPNSKTIVFLGTFFKFSGLVEALQSFEMLSREDEYFLLVGGGDLEPELREVMKGCSSKSRVVLTGFVPFSMVPKYLRVASVGINPMEISMVTNAAFPNKVIQYLAAGLAVTSTSLDGLVSTFHASEGIRYLDSPGKVMEGALEMARRVDVIALGQKNRALLETDFSVDITVSHFESRLLKLTGSK